MASNCESLDTNILIRIVLQDNPKQCASIDKLFETNHTFHIADLAISEMVYVLSNLYDFNRPTIAMAIKNFLSEPKINCNRALFSEVLPLWLSHPTLSFTDCCLAAYAKLNQSEPLWTFDKKLAKQTAAAKELV